jgi:CheY-like chemotaxis protein
MCLGKEGVRMTNHRGHAEARPGAHDASLPPLVLVVDDEAMIIDMVSRVVTDVGFRVARARNGQQALDMIAGEQPALIISDIRMPHLDGLLLVQRIREQGLSIPIILISAHYADIELPGVAFLPKPFELHALRDLIHRQLSRSQRQSVTGSS